MYQQKVDSEQTNLVYMSASDAIRELRLRQEDHKLRKYVIDFLGSVPSYLDDGNKAVLGRPVATPNYELLRFIELTRNLGLTPVVMELPNDKFCTRNPEKLSLLKMPFFRGNNRSGNISFRYYKAANCNEYQGRPIGDITTYSCEGLSFFHHRLLEAAVPQNKLPILVSDEIHFLYAGRPRDYYTVLLARFICHGVFFENFTSSKDEKTFYENVVLPAFLEIVNRFGLPPLVVRLLPSEIEDNVYWRCYPNELISYVDRSVINDKGY
jgi:hypothetical protein